MKLGCWSRALLCWNPPVLCWNRDGAEKWAAGILLSVAGIQLCAAGTQLLHKNGPLEPHPVWASKFINRDGVGGEGRDASHLEAEALDLALHPKRLGKCSVVFEGACQTGLAPLLRDDRFLPSGVPVVSSIAR